jgi:hypothetical protein
MQLAEQDCRGRKTHLIKRPGRQIPMCCIADEHGFNEQALHAGGMVLNMVLPVFAYL